MKNAQELCRGLQELGYKIVTDGTDNHLILVDLRTVGLTGSKGEKILEEIEIACNKNTGKKLTIYMLYNFWIMNYSFDWNCSVPGDKSAMNPSGIRLGTPALTTRGLKEDDIKQVVQFIHQGLQLALEVSKVSGPKLVDYNRVLREDESFRQRVASIRHQVEDFASAFPM